MESVAARARERTRCSVYSNVQKGFASLIVNGIGGDEGPGGSIDASRGTAARAAARVGDQRKPMDVSQGGAEARASALQSYRASSLTLSRSCARRAVDAPRSR